MDKVHSFKADSPLAPIDNMSRMPQYNDANESASEKGQASSENALHSKPRPATFNAAPSTSTSTATALPSSTETETDTNDTIGAGWEMPDRPTPSASGTNDVSTSDISLPAIASFAAGATAGSELSINNMDIHNIMNRRDDPVNNWLFNHDQRTIVSSGLIPNLGSNTRASVLSSTELGESAVPVSEFSALCGIGGWADNPRPHTA